MRQCVLLFCVLFLQMKLMMYGWSTQQEVVSRQLAEEDGGCLEMVKLIMLLISIVV